MIGYEQNLLRKAASQSINQLSSPLIEPSFSLEVRSLLVAYKLIRFLLIADNFEFVEVFSWLWTVESLSVGLGGLVNLVLRI